MRSPVRALLSATAIAAVAVSLSACNSWSAKCDTDNNCEVSMQGDTSHPYPRPFSSSEGTESNKAEDRIALVSATEGGEAVIRAGLKDNTCTQGSSFQIADTTITCEVVGDDKVELTSTRP